MTDRVESRIRAVRHIRLYSLASLQSSILHYSATNRRISLQSIRSTQHGKVCKADLVAISVDDSRHAKVACVHCVMTDVELKVPTVVQLTPLQLAVRSDEILARIVRFRDSDVLARRTGRRHCCPCKLDANASSTCGRVVGRVV